MNLHIVLPLISVSLIAAFILWGIVYTWTTGKPFIVVNFENPSPGSTDTAPAIEGQAVTIDALQGEWRMLECGKRGRFAPVEELALADVRMKVLGDRLTMLGSGATDILHLNGSTFPTELDQVGPDGEVTRCIARMINGQLELSQADVGKPRPTDFSRLRSNPNTVVRFTRLGDSPNPSG